MRLGALLGPVSNSSAANMLAEQARTYVDEGFDSLWSAQAIGRGFMTTDPIVTLSVAATVTESVELGTAVLQVLRKVTSPRSIAPTRHAFESSPPA